MPSRNVEKVFIPSVDSSSVGVGFGAIDEISTGRANTGVGYNSLTSVTTGSNNVALGDSTANTLVSGSGNIIIGHAADVASASASDTLNIGGVITATGIGTTNAVVMPGTLSVTGGIIDGKAAISTAQLNKTSDATLAPIVGLSIPLVAGGKYIIEAYIPCTSGASGGVKVAFASDGTLTATSVNYTATLSTAAAAATVTTTTLGTGLGSTAAVINAYIEGTIVVNAAGSLLVQFAQNVSNGTASSAYVNGNIKATRVA